MILKFFLVHKAHSPPAHSLEPHVVPDSLGVPPGWPPAPSLAGRRERVETGSKLRERLHPRPLPPEPQLIPFPMRDGEYDDDQSTARSKAKTTVLDRSERVYPREQVPQEPQIRPMVCSMI